MSAEEIIGEIQGCGAQGEENCPDNCGMIALRNFSKSPDPRDQQYCQAANGRQYGAQHPARCRQIHPDAISVVWQRADKYNKTQPVKPQSNQYND